MRSPVLVFDYINRVAAQVGRDPKADNVVRKTLATPTKGVSQALGGQPPKTR